MKYSILHYTSLAVTLMVTGYAQAQQGFGTNMPDPSAAVDITSKNKGLLIPRIALTGINNAAPVRDPGNSLMVYNTAVAAAGTENEVKPGYYYWFRPDETNPGKWVRIGQSNDEPWHIQNTDIAATTNNQNIYQQGKVAVGFDANTAVSGKQFEVKGDLKADKEIDGKHYVLETGSVLGDKPSNLMYVADENFLESGALFMSLDEIRLGTNTNNGDAFLEARGLYERTSTTSLAEMQTFYKQDMAQIKVKSSDNPDNNGIEFFHRLDSGVENMNAFMNAKKGVTFKFTNPSSIEAYTFPRTGGTENQVMTSGGTVNGEAQLSWKNISDLVTANNPWKIQNTATDATNNTDNIYQQGKVAVGFTAADEVSAKQLDVKGDFKADKEIDGKHYVLETGSLLGDKPSNLMYAADENFETLGSLFVSPDEIRLGTNSTNSLGTPEARGTYNSSATGAFMDMQAIHNGDQGRAYLKVQSSDNLDADGIELTHRNSNNGLFEAGNYLHAVKGVTFKFRDSSSAQEQYTFPRTGGNANQVLTSGGTVNGEAQLSWENAEDLISGKDLTGNGITISPDGTGAVLKDIQLGIADNAVTSVKLADSAVTTAKINDKAVTPSKIANGAANQILVTNAAGDAVTWVNQSTLTPATTNELTSAVNTITSKVNGVSATAPVVNNVATTLTGNTLTTSVNGVSATADLSGLTNTTGLANGTNTTVSGNGSTATPYVVNVATANATTAGIVKQAATNATVTVNAQGELAVNPTTVATALGKNLTVSEGIEINSGSGTAALLTAAGLRIANNGVATAKLADKAVTNEKINPGTADKQVLVTSGTGSAATTQWVDQSTLTDNTTANNGLTKTANNIQLGGNLTQATTITNNGQALTIATGGTATAITGLPNTSAADYNGTNGVTADKMVSMGANGVLKQLKAAMPKFFYAPSIALPTAPDQTSTSSADDIYYTPSSQIYTIKLYSIYSKQFGGTVTTGTSNTGKVANTTRTTALPMLGSSDLDYYITFFDTTVFSDVTVSDTGVMTYKIKPTADVTIGSFMNIVFAVKP